MKANRLTFWILIAMGLGIGVGYVVNSVYAPALDGRVVWSIVPVTGKARVDSQGVVHAISNGSVYVKAVSRINPKAADSILINIRNQTSRIADSTGITNINQVQDPQSSSEKANAEDPSNVQKISLSVGGSNLPEIKSDQGTLQMTCKSSSGFIDSFSKNMKLLTTIFLRLVQMIIAPLVFCTLVVGIAKLGDLKTVGRVGGKSILWFLSASLISLLIGLILVNVFQPGSAIDLSNADKTGAQDLIGKTQEFSLAKFIDHVFPRSVFEAMAQNEILQLVVFSIFFGVAATALHDYSKPVVKALDAASHIILKMVGYVMNVAPFGVFGAMAAVIATKGLSVFVFYGQYLSSFLVGILLLWILLFAVGFGLLGSRMQLLLRRIAQPILIAFSTSSSEAVFPKLTEELERFGCKDKVVSFVLPLGYSFNLDGSMMYMTFASLAIAQAYGVHMDLGTQLTMLLVLMLTSKGIAGVPRASLVVVTATCAMFNIPPEGIALILPIDHFCDMFRSATNVVGNALATTAVSKWEGELDEPSA